MAKRARQGEDQDLRPSVLAPPLFARITRKLGCAGHPSLGNSEFAAARFQLCRTCKTKEVCRDWLGTFDDPKGYLRFCPNGHELELMAKGIEIANTKR